MAASDYITETPPLLPGTTARAEDVNEKFDALSVAFEKLPVPRAAGGGFSEPVHVGEAVQSSHALSRGQLDAVLGPLQQAINQVLALATAVDPYAAIKFVDDEVYELSADDNGKVVWFTSDNPVTIIMRGDSSLPFDGALQGLIIQGGQGIVSAAGDGESSILSSGGLVSTGKQYAPISYIRVAGNAWWLGGERA